MTTITRDELHSALTDLGEKVADAGKVVDLLVYGGSCLMLVSNFRLSSADVDAVALTDQPFIDSKAREIAAARGWPLDWLNDGVRTFLSPSVDDTDSHELTGTYPSEAKPGVRVFVPTPDYMLAMKLMAMRVGPGSDGGKDLDDILNLMQIVGIDQKKHIVDFAARFYPEARVSGKLILALDNLWTQYQSRIATKADVPPRYLGRTGPQTQH